MFMSNISNARRMNIESEVLTITALVELAVMLPLAK